MSDRINVIPLPPPQDGRVDVLVIAGEHSGDEQAARMIGAMLHRNPGINVAALGGPELARNGAQLLFDLTASSVVGFVEVLRHYGFFRRLFSATLDWIEQYQPRVVCFVDYPGFNLRLAQALRNRGISRRGKGRVRTAYYISPQIWAWKAHRRFAMARTLDALAVIFPFETECYADTDLETRFVGHPFAGPHFRSTLHYAHDAPVLLLPGSRQAAVHRIFPVLRDAFAAYLAREPAAQALVIYPEQPIKDVVQTCLRGHKAIAERLALVPKGSQVTASAVLTSSGTMSLQCALAGIPGAIAYRTNPFTYLLARQWVDVPFIGIGNLLLKEAMYPEYIQKQATAESLARELEDCVSNASRIERTKSWSTKLHELLRQPMQGDAASWLSDQLSS